MFIKGNLYRRRDLHALYGGQQQGGISTPPAHPFIFLFTSPRGEEYGCIDGWQKDGVTFLYTGEERR
jgi:5-methylcytosine-specific restriction protein A